MLPVTSCLAIVLAGFVQALGIVVIRRRRALAVKIGDGGDDGLARAIRAQGNLVEYGLVVTGLIALAELNGAPTVWLVLLAGVLVASRICHAYALLVAEPDAARGPSRFRYRTAAMAMTFSALTLAALTLLGAVVLAL